MRTLAAATFVATLIVSPFAQAGESPDHFEGQPAADLQQALHNLAEYNARLAAILDKQELAAADHHEIHQLTYTLENALERIDKEVNGMAVRLEAIHAASEARDSATIRRQAPGYLSAADELAPE